VIAKIRAFFNGTCGCAPTISVRVQGILMHSTTQTPYSSYTTVRTTDVTKTFPTNGAIQTTYIPNVGTSGYHANGWYIATGTLNPAGAPAVSSTNTGHVTNVP
jgi:hypothetical protein